MHRGLTAAITIVLLLGLLATAAPRPVSAQRSALPLQGLEPFFDAMVADGMQRFDLPGVVIAVVHDGELVFSRGYGHANVLLDIPVDPETTLFDLGSIAKTFTFTAVMQLAEQGRLDLDADVNRYLTQFQVPQAFGQPVTARHLLTHTAGFDETDLGAAARSPEEVLPVCTYLAENLPPRILPPGEIIAYSNHGAALAGCLVEEISGLPFAEYIDRHILQPLGMERTTFAWPEALMQDMAVGYARQPDGSLESMDIYYRHFGPAGELKSTAHDMARYMIAHLQLGQLGDARILETETARAMHRQQFTLHPVLTGFTFGFFEDVFNGRRAIVHGGDTNPIFSSLMVLFPEEDIGLLVAHNTADHAFREVLVSAFADRYLPRESPLPIPPAPDPERDLQHLTGTYLPTFMLRETTLERLLTLLSHFRVSQDEAGWLVLHEPAHLWARAPMRWTEVEPLVFQSPDGEGLLVFVEDAQGELRYMATSLYPAVAFLPRAWYDTASFHGIILGISLLLFVIAIVAWFRRHEEQPALRRHLTGAQGLFCLALTVGTATALQVLGFEGIFGAPLWLHILFSVPLLIAGIALASVVTVARAWLSAEGSMLNRVLDTFVLLATVAFLWQVHYWNLLVFRL